jgi:hypothetical protein
MIWTYTYVDVRPQSTPRALVPLFLPVGLSPLVVHYYHCHHGDNARMISAPFLIFLLAIFAFLFGLVTGQEEGGGGGGGDYIDSILSTHNALRAASAAGPLGWSDALASAAAEAASSCSYGHNMGVDGLDYGQNIGAGQRPDEMEGLIRGLFYDGEVSNYNWFGGEPDGGDAGGWGHFTQIVWKDTSEIGCATVDCSGSGLAGTNEGVTPWFTICNYSPPGRFSLSLSLSLSAPSVVLSSVALVLTLLDLGDRQYHGLVCCQRRGATVMSILTWPALPCSGFSLIQVVLACVSLRLAEAFRQRNIGTSPPLTTWGTFWACSVSVFMTFGRE